MTLASLELRRQRLAHSRRGLTVPLALAIGVSLAYLGAFATVVAADRWISIALAPVLGMLVVMLFVIGHDACHQSFTTSARLNRIIGTLVFLPALHAYSMWDHDHNRRHHRFNNIRRLDCAWEPMTPEEFNVAPLGRRLLYRFYRDPRGALFYYLIEVWLKRMIWPRRRELGEILPVHVFDAALVWTWTLVQVTVAALVGTAFGKSVLESVMLAIAIPFLAFSIMISVAIMMHHTHPEVPWYRDIDEWRRGHGAVRGVVHVEFPWLVRKLFLNIMEHPAHHYAPGVPLYRLHELQTAMTGPDIVVERFSIPRFLAICARCKLFDYESGEWRNFHGQPTSQLLHAGARMRWQRT